MVKLIKELFVLVKLPRGKSDLKIFIVKRKKFVVCITFQGKSAFSFVVQQCLEQFSNV